MKPFPKEKEALLEEHHHKIFDFMRYERLDDEFYDILAFSLMEAIREYDPEKIRNIDGFIFFKLRRGLNHYYEYVYAKKRKAWQERMDLFDFIDYPEQYFNRSVPSMETSVINKMFFEDILYGDITTEQEKIYCKYLMLGYEVLEISKILNQHFYTVRSRISTMRRKLRDYYYAGIVPLVRFRPDYMDYIFCPACRNTEIWGKGFPMARGMEMARFQCKGCKKKFEIPLYMLSDCDVISAFLFNYYRNQNLKKTRRA